MRTALITAKQAIGLFALAAVMAMLVVACGGEDEPTATPQPDTSPTRCANRTPTAA